MNIHLMRMLKHWTGYRNVGAFIHNHGSRVMQVLDTYWNYIQCLQRHLLTNTEHDKNVGGSCFIYSHSWVKGHAVIHWF